MNKPVNILYMETVKEETKHHIPMIKLSELKKGRS